MSQLSEAGRGRVEELATVEIDRRDETERWRYVCPNGHTDWDRTNNHIWCRSCRHQHEHGADMDPEHWHLVDRRTDDEIPWRAVEIVGEK